MRQFLVKLEQVLVGIAPDQRDGGFVLAGKHRTVARQSGPLANNVLIHIVKGGEFKARLQANLLDPRTNIPVRHPSNLTLDSVLAHVRLNHRAVLGNKRQAFQPQILLNIQHLCRGFAAAENDRNLVILQPVHSRGMAGCQS